jgi:hypothetical protein
MDWYCPPAPHCPLCGVQLPPSPFVRPCFCGTCWPLAVTRAVWVDQVQPGQWFVVLWSETGRRWQMGRQAGNVPRARRQGTGDFEVVPPQWRVVVVEEAR